MSDLARCEHGRDAAHAILRETPLETLDQSGAHPLLTPRVRHSEREDPGGRPERASGQQPDDRVLRDGDHGRRMLAHVHDELREVDLDRERVALQRLEQMDRARQIGVHVVPDDEHGGWLPGPRRGR